MSTFQSVASTYHTVSYCNLSKSTAIFTIQLQPPQSNCNLHNQSAKVPQLTYTVGQSYGVSVTAISTIQLQSPQSNCNLRNPTAISTIRLQKFLNLHIQLVIQRRVGDCNLRYLTAICAIQLQSPQSNCNFHNPTTISTIRLQKFLNLHIQLVIQRRVGDCNLHNPTAISAIQL